MVKEFELSKSKGYFFMLVLIPILFLGFELITLGSLFFSPVETKYMLIIALTFLASLVLIYMLFFKMYFQSKYSIDDQYLKITFGLAKKEILLRDINYITEGKMMSCDSGYFLDWSGLKINYSEGYWLYISPLKKKDFINSLLEKNQNINLAEALLDT